MSELKFLKLKEIEQGDNVRSKFSKDSILSLSQSIKENGVLQPLLVMKSDDKFKLIAGFRRYVAAELAGLSEVPVQISEIENIEETQLIENLQREDLGPLDEAKAYKKLLDEHTIDDLTVMIGKGKWHVAQRLSLLSLSLKAKEAMSKGLISAGHGTTLARLKNPKLQDELLKDIISDRLSIQQTEVRLEQYSGSLANAPFDKKDCANCISNGAKAKDLFDGELSLKGVCLNKDCYGLKTKEFLVKRKADLSTKKFHVMDRDKFHSDEVHQKAKPIAEYNINDIGNEAFKENCLKPCEDFLVVLNKDGAEDKFCLKVSCWKRLAKLKASAEKSKGKGKKDEEPEKSSADEDRAPVRIDETQRRFMLDKLRRMINDKLMLTVSLEALFASESGNGRTIGKFLKSVGLATKEDQNWQVRRDLASQLYALSDKEAKGGLFDAVSMRLEVYSTEDLIALGKFFKVDTSMFRVDEEYLNKRTREGLMKLIKEFELKAPEDLEKKPKIDIVGFILAAKVDRAPKEVK